MQQQRIPNYEILRVMGHGVFGYVFEAWDPTYNRLVAMKRVQKKSNQVSREYEMLIELQGCPNIIQLIDFYYSKNDDGELVQNMVFEHMDSNLEHVLKQHQMFRKAIEEPLLKSYIHQALVGTQEMHSRGICHRDLKPENMLVNSHQVLKICDFGSGKILNQQGLNTPYVVTQYYRAPELIMSHSDYTTAIDVWALGCIFFELATLRIMFEGISEGDQLFKMLEVLGTPNETTLSILLEKAQCRNDIRKRMLGFSGVSMMGYFQRYSFGDKLHDLIMSMVRFDPNDRITCQQALNHPIFESA